MKTTLIFTGEYYFKTFLKIDTMKENIEKRALSLFNECCKLGLNCSYRSVLNSMYETASQKKQYIKCSIIQDLIIQDINS